MTTVDTASVAATAQSGAASDAGRPDSAGRRASAPEDRQRNTGPDSGQPGVRRSVVLVGLMGAGKSSVGRRLASRIGFDFIDADTEIEKAAGASIPEIFAEHGEAAFRDGERKVIARLLDQKGIVLATGGGAYMNEETRARIREKAVSVWLKAELDVLVKRCARRTHRPLLNNGDLRGTLARLMEQRYPVYAEADYTVISDDGPHDDVVDQIIAVLPACYRRDDASGRHDG